MLSEEVKRYTEITGEDGWVVSMSRLGGFLDGYDKGQADRIKWHDLTKDPADVPPDIEKDYLYLFKFPNCKVQQCAKWKNCDIFDENCTSFFYTYDVLSGDPAEYSDGHEIAWADIPLFEGKI